MVKTASCGMLKHSPTPKSLVLKEQDRSLANQSWRGVRQQADSDPCACYTIGNLT